MKTITIQAPVAKRSSNVQVSNVAKIRRSQLLHFIIEHGFGLFLCSSLALCGALLFVFGLFLMNGWTLFLGICTGVLSYVMFTNKDYDEYSIKEALENLVAGKEVQL